jgi:hypothetical protein
MRDLRPRRIQVPDQSEGGVSREAYFPAVILAEHDSPIDALIGLRLARDEAMDLVAAACASGSARCVLARVDGGRQVAAVLLANGRWAACNAFTKPPCASPREAERRLEKLLRGGRRGIVGTLPTGVSPDEPGSEPL